MDPRYPATSIGVRAEPSAAGAPAAVSSWSLPPFDAARYERLSIVCGRPLHHVLEYSQLFRLIEGLRQQAPHLRVDLLLRSALQDWRSIEGIGADRVEALPRDGDRNAWSALARGLDQRGSAALLLDTDSLPGELRAAAPGATWLDGGQFDFEASGEESAGCVRAAQSYYEALGRETPRWLGAAGGLVLATATPSFLIHQSRFRVGNTLWLTPLLRAIRRHFPGARITVVGSRTTARVLDQVPLADEILVVDPDGGAVERGRLLGRLRRRRFDAAILALARREKSRWLAEALTDMQVTYRINLEYVEDPELVPSNLFTHEAWFFWCAIASARFLLHGLSPFVKGQSGSGGRWLDDRCVVFPVRQAWRREAERVLADLGFGDAPFAVLAPGGASSDRWPTHKYAALALRLSEELGLRVLIEGGPAEGPLLERTRRQVAAQRRSGGPPATCRVSQDSLGVLAALLERASLLVANDSAPIHLAEATGTPTLYFSHHEKLTHSHPSRRTHWALYELRHNRLADISVDSVLSVVRRMVECAHVELRQRADGG